MSHVDFNALKAMSDDNLTEGSLGPLWHFSVPEFYRQGEPVLVSESYGKASFGMTVVDNDATA